MVSRLYIGPLSERIMRQISLFGALYSIGRSVGIFFDKFSTPMAREGQWHCSSKNKPNLGIHSCLILSGLVLLSSVPKYVCEAVVPLWTLAPL